MTGAKKEHSQTPRWAIVVAWIVVISGIIATGGAIYWLFSSAKPELATTLLAAVGTVLVTLVSIIGTRYYERQSHIDQELRSKKVPIYEDFIAFLFTMMFAGKLKQRQLTEDEMMAAFAKFTREALIWGSDEVVQEFTAFRKMAADGVGAQANTIWQIEKLLFAIRKDMGHQNRGLSRGSLLGMFVNDIDKADL